MKRQIRKIQPLVTGELRREKKTDHGLPRAPGSMRDLPTIAFFRAVALLRRYGPVPGILATRRPGAIMDKSGCPRLVTLNPLKQAEFQLTNR
jgi:hypothetical protein